MKKPEAHQRVLRNLFSEREEAGFTLVELIVVIIIIAILSQIGLVSWNRYTRRARAFAAQTAIRNIKTECEANRDLGVAQTFTPISLSGYSIQPDNSNSCGGGSGSGLVSAIPENPDDYPTYWYDFEDGSINCEYNNTSDTLFSKCASTLQANLEANDFVFKDTYIKRGCSAYVIVKGESFDEAEANSKKIGGNLVTINDKSEYSWIKENITKENKILRKSGYEINPTQYAPNRELINTNGAYWVGLTDANKEGEYKWTSGQKTDFGNNQILIHRQNWIAQQHNAASNDYFLLWSNDRGYTDYEQKSYRPDLYTGKGVGMLTWTDNKSSFYQKNPNWDAPHFGIAEIPTCKN